MPRTLEPQMLARRLAGLRRRLRLVATLRGGSLLLTTLVLSLALPGLLDWRLHLPAPVRAVFLVGALSAIGFIAWRYLIAPLRARSDDLSLALRVEAQYPELNDCLASAVQFLHPATAAAPVQGEALKQAAIRQALSRADSCNFNRIVDRRGVGTASLSMMVAASLGVALLLLFPTEARTALARLASPFGSVEWPLQTRFADLTPRNRVARGEAFEVRGTLEGVIPERGVVVFWFDGTQPREQVCPIGRTSEGTATLSAKLEPAVVAKSFRYQVRANDTVTPWRQVTVVPPPELVPLDGRPSPRLTLSYPAYTELPDQALPDGRASVEGAVPGTIVRLFAGVNRPLSAAWIEYRADQAPLDVAAFLAPLGATSTGSGLALSRGGQEVWGRVDATLEMVHGVQTINVKFLPWLSGTYVLHLVDESGLHSTRQLDVRLQPDPAPTVNLERPSASLDSLLVLPGAEITVQVTADDPVYALRSAYLTYRCRKEDPPRRLPLYDHPTLRGPVPFVQAILASTQLPTPPGWLPRPQHWQLTTRLPLKQLRHLDGSPLRAGDVVTLQACADDFDNVAVDKQPGRSHEVELRIGAPADLEAALHHAQAQVQQELLKLREQQRDAIKKVDAVEKQWRNTGKLRPEELETLREAEQVQKQVRDRVGTQQEGLRAEVARILQALKDNDLPRSGTHERMEDVASNLERLAHAELELIEPLLTNARKENELASKTKPDKKKPNALNEALEHQEKVEETLNTLLARLEPWSTTREVKGEARTLLQEQRRLATLRDQLEKKLPAGENPQNLKPQESAELDKTAQDQARLAEHTNQLLNKMERVALEKERRAAEKEALAGQKERLAEKQEAEARKLENAEPEKARLLSEEAQAQRAEAKRLHEEAESLRAEAKTLNQAAAEARQAELAAQMKNAAQDVAQNQLGKAGKEQQAGTEAMEKLIKSLEEQREGELNQLIKKIRDTEQPLAELIEKQELLQKKVREAQQIADPEKRAEELKRLSREQEKLRKETQEMVKHLSRLRADRAREALSRAGGEMEDAGQQMEKGGNADEQQEDALDRLEDAQRELQRAREDAEEELAREKLVKIADQLRRIKERHEALIAEADRIHQEILQRKGLDRALQTSLLRLRDAQAGLGEEVASLADGKLKDALVFNRLLGRAGDLMKQAADRIEKRVNKAKDDEGDFDAAAEEGANRRTSLPQRDALAMLDQLLDALKPDVGAAQRSPKGGQAGGGEGSRAESDGIPHLAQLKALKALQQDVNRRTDEFARKHPDNSKLTPAEREELAAIKSDQKEIADLLQELTAPAAEPEGGKP